MISKNTYGAVAEKIKQTTYVRLFGLTKIPLIWFISPVIEKLDELETIVKIPLKRKTKNHLNSMYFGVMCAAADIAGGLCAMKHIQDSGKKISLSFKDFKAEFHKRAEADTYFINNQGQEIKEFVEKVIASGERMNMPVEVVATTPTKFGDEPVATFTLTLSLKLKS